MPRKQPEIPTFAPTALIAILGIAGVARGADGPGFQERGGLVVVEAESTTSHLGSWKKKTEVEDYGGECHLEFTGNKPELRPPKSPLKYRFRVSKVGKYQLSIRARKRLETKREDQPFLDSWDP